MRATATQAPPVGQHPLTLLQILFFSYLVIPIATPPPEIKLVTDLVAQSFLANFLLKCESLM